MQDTKQDIKVKAAEALAILDQAWAYYTPEPVHVTDTENEPELFTYANAA